jgi:predicted ATP-dependent serine protease
MIPKFVEYICENCNSNIDNNWWWCPKCGNNVALIEIKHYSKYQRTILAFQKLFSCARPQQDNQVQSVFVEQQVEREVDEVTSYIKPTRIYRESYV